MSETNHGPLSVTCSNADWALISGPVDAALHQTFAGILTELSHGPADAPIKINFSTYGGSCYEALAIYDMIKASRRPVWICVNGPCMSAGTLIVQAAARRLASKNSHFLIHFGSEVSESQSEQKHNKSIEKDWHAIFAARTGMSMRTIKRIHAAESYFSADDALKQGLIDEVVG